MFNPEKKIISSTKCGTDGLTIAELRMRGNDHGRYKLKTEEGSGTSY